MKEKGFSKRSKLVLFSKNRWNSREKILKNFVKMLKEANLPQVDWFSRITRKFAFWKNRWFFRKKMIFWKQLSLANLMSTATETISQFDVKCEGKSEISQNVQKLGFLQKKAGFPKKTLKVLKIADGSKFAVQWEGISKVSQNVQLLRFGSIKECFGFSRKTEVF